ncbi:hypothetical protein T484DRAFT_1770887 [Baffinella frigidus]|nr:hypothetical protein T484DRAFT_1770887 [Cryptophyta sp. CCMP2293]
MVRGRIAFASVLNCFKTPAPAQGGLGGSGEARAVTVFGGDDLQITFKRVNPVGVREIKDIFVL